LPWRKRLKRSGAFDEAPLQEERAREDAAATDRPVTEVRATVSTVKCAIGAAVALAGREVALVEINEQ